MLLQHLDTTIAFAVVMLGISLLITVMTQILAAVLDLRGANLLWGLTKLLENVEEDPDSKLRHHAGAIAEAVLRHPLVSDSSFARWRSIPIIRRWKLASVIRQDEFLEILKRIPVSTLDLGKKPWWRSEKGWKQQVEDSRKAAEQFTFLLQNLAGDWAPTISDVVTKIRGLPYDTNDEKREVNSLIVQIASAPIERAESLKRWFDRTMDRVSSRFTVQMRWCTVLCSGVVAFALHLDSLALFTQLSTDAELRSSLVASAESMTKQAEEIIGSGAGRVPSVYREAMLQLKQLEADRMAGVGDPPDFTSRTDAEMWLQTKIASDDAAQLMARYRELVQQSLRGAIDKLADEAASIRGELSKTRLNLIPDPYHPLSDLMENWPRNRHFWGVLASAALLSLGAPFWFNALKHMTGLRPVLARKEDQERQQRQTT